MWTRLELKQRAKSVLKGKYWKAFLISFVIAIATGGGAGNSIDSARDNYSPGGSFVGPYGGYYGGGSLPEFTLDEGFVYRILFLITAVFGILLVSWALRVFLGFPLEVGGRRYFVQSASFNDNRGCFRFAFNGYNYKGIISTMLVKGIYNFLWFLLLVIPGIVKGYAYSMVPYILADNPNIGVSKAISLSNRMTHGHKLDMFILDLSFIGWYLLGALALGVGVFFVLPYVDATKAELYLALRQEAIDRNFCSMEDLALAYKEPRLEHY